MTASADILVLSGMVESDSSLVLVTSSASAVGIDVKSDTTSKDTMISCGSIVQLEIFLTKSLLFVTVNWLRCNGDKIVARLLNSWDSY